MNDVSPAILNKIQIQTLAQIAADLRQGKDFQITRCTEINLETDPLPTDEYDYGGTKISLICGWPQPPEEWSIPWQSSEWLSAGSIIIRLEFASKSVLFAGDAVGRYKDSEAGTCMATEKYACDHARERPIRSDVIVAPHHGGNNASSEDFIAAVDPKWVIFSAGHNYHHPTAAAAQRYIDHGIPPRKCSARIAEITSRIGRTRRKSGGTARRLGAKTNLAMTTLTSSFGRTESCWLPTATPIRKMSPRMARACTLRQTQRPRERRAARPNGC